MSKHQLIPNVQLAVSLPMNHGGLLTLTALLLAGLAVPAPAQNNPAARVELEKHFTIPPGVRTPVVLQTEPDAACDLHAEGVYDPSQTLKLYGNIEGYVRFHFTPNHGLEDANLQLDCTAHAALTLYPLHLRIAVSPTPDMPAPPGIVPAPAGSRIRPALTDEAARQLADQDLIAQGYPPRPNPTQSPDAYAQWLGRVSRPMTILPPHSVSRSDVREGLPAGTQSPNWSGFAAAAKGAIYVYQLVEGQWTVPSVSCSTGSFCYSSAWVGLGAALIGSFAGDLVQAGTEHDSFHFAPSRSVPVGATADEYYAWTEIYPQQLSAQEVLSVSAGDPITVFVYVGDSNGNIDPFGSYAWFFIEDQQSGRSIATSTPIAGQYEYVGNTAEWIVERPCLNCGTSSYYFPPLSDYGSLEMKGAYVLPDSGPMVPYSQAVTGPLAGQEQLEQFYMWDIYNTAVLSSVAQVPGCSSCMLFSWKNFL